MLRCLARKGNAMRKISTENELTLIQNLKGYKTDNTPFWFMRQAGRYLPEYRELRAKAGGFLNLAYNPDWASEVTLQPIRRFGMNGAILFSDILVIPHALGQDLRFETGEGPKLNPLSTLEDIDNLNLENIDITLSPIYETLRQCRQKLADEKLNDTAMIGFAGSPWALQLFDSWAGILDEKQFQKWVIEPTKAIVANIRHQHPDIPLIGFPREAGDKIINYSQQIEINGLGLDFSMSPQWAHDNLPADLCLQGNLDPHYLMIGGQAMEDEALRILEIMQDRPFIFNLGHGVIKETPPENVKMLSNIIRDFNCSL